MTNPEVVPEVAPEPSADKGVPDPAPGTHWVFLGTLEQLPSA